MITQVSQGELMRIENTCGPEWGLLLIMPLTYSLWIPFRLDTAPREPDFPERLGPALNRV